MGKNAFEQLKDWYPTGAVNLHLRDRNLLVYVRHSQRLVFRDHRKLFKCLDIATVDAYPTGQGHFTRFMEQVEAWSPDVIHVENVMTDRFAEFFRKRGYLEIVHSGIPSFFRVPYNSEAAQFLPKTPIVDRALPLTL
jgi:hypothetical protein